MTAEDRITMIKDELQRVNPLERPEWHARLFSLLITAEQERRATIKREQAS